MQHGEGRFTGAGGVELYYQCWRPEGEPRAAVAIVHGVGEHSGRYTNVVGPLTEDGYAVYGYDQRGHGVSPGRRVHIDRWNDYRGDLAAFLGTVAEREGGRPIVVYGHSMGALVVLDYLLQRPPGLAGAIVSGAPLEPAGVAKPALVAMVRALSGVLPRLSVNLGLDVGALSRDPEVLQAYVADPLVTSRATVRWGAESLDTVRRVKEGMARIDVPLLVLHGEADALNMAEGARALFDAVPRADKTLRIYPGGYHEPHNDLDHDQAAADIKGWLGHLFPSEAAR
ncbi:MAG TPA: lysophospholipase [Propionibacteriaceae bacterium]